MNDSVKLDIQGLTDVIDQLVLEQEEFKVDVLTALEALGGALTALGDILEMNDRDKPIVPPVEPSDFLRDGEALGADMIPSAWGVYDDTDGFEINSQTRSGLQIELTRSGKNQRIWKVIDGLNSGDYILRFRLDSEWGGSGAVNLIQYEPPYHSFGYGREHEAGKTVTKRIKVSSPGSGPASLQFCFDGCFSGSETYTISDLHFWGIHHVKGVGK